jgi:hypothetical protein
MLNHCVLGLANANEVLVPCGRFTEEYIEALKGLPTVDVSPIFR